MIASNRIGVECEEEIETTFYGSSFIADAHGAKVAEADRSAEAVLVHSFDLDKIEAVRSGWGVFRDRRPELYGALGTLDGKIQEKTV